MPDPLLGSPSRAFFLPRSRTLFPAPFPSWCFDTFRVLLHARVRYPVQLFKLKTEHVALLGLFPSRVFILSTLVRPSSDLPSCGCPFGLTAERIPLQGLSRRECGLSLSRLPTLLGFVAFWSSCSFEPRLDSGVASEGAWGTLPPPHQPFFESLRKQPSGFPVFSSLFILVEAFLTSLAPYADVDSHLRECRFPGQHRA
jgi:hypothetical protein